MVSLEILTHNIKDKLSNPLQPCHDNLLSETYFIMEKV